MATDSDGYNPGDTIKAATYSYDDFLSATMGHIEFCLGKAEMAENRTDVESWKQR